MAVRKVYKRAEELLLRDRHNQTEQIAQLSKAIQKVLYQYVAYDRDTLSIATYVTDKLTLSIEVDIKGFKHLQEISQIEC